MLIFWVGCFFLGKCAADITFGQYQWVRKRKGGLWLTSPTSSFFTKPDKQDMSDEMITCFKQKGWRIEDYREKRTFKKLFK